MFTGEMKDGRPHCVRGRRFTEKTCPEGMTRKGPVWRENHCGESRDSIHDTACRTGMVEWHGDEQRWCREMVERFDRRVEACYKREDWPERHEWHFKPEEAARFEGVEFPEETDGHAFCEFEAQSELDKGVDCWKIHEQYEHGKKDFLHLDNSDGKSNCYTSAGERHHGDGKTEYWCPEKFIGGEELIHLHFEDGKAYCWWEAQEEWFHGSSKYQGTAAATGTAAEAGKPGEKMWIRFPDAQPAYAEGPFTWHGAEALCASRGASLCSYEDMCPHGEAGPHFEGVHGAHPGPGDNWAPYKDEEFKWLNTGDQRPCRQEGGPGSDGWHSNSHCCDDAAPMVCCRFH